jgi:putative aldouronate transport system substrate-binding protein
MKKFLALLLALVMVLGLAACAPKDAADDTKPADTKPADTKPADDATEPAGNGIIPAAELTHDEEITVKMILPAWSDYAGRDEVMAKAKEMVKADLNINLEYIYIEDGDTPETIMTTGAGWDLGNCNAAVFQNLAARNAFLDLTPYIEAGYLAYPMENLSDGQKAAHQVNGKQVGFAPIKDLMEVWNLQYNATMLEDIGVAVPEWQSVWDLVPFFKEVKEKTQGTKWETETLWGSGNHYLPAWWQIDGLCGSWNNVLAATNIDLEKLSSMDDIDPMTVFCPWFTEDFAEMIHTRKQMIADGIEWGYKLETGHGMTMQNLDWHFGMPCGHIIWEQDASDCHFAIKNNASYGYTSYVQAVSQVVNANTENPERVLELMNYFYENEAWNNLVHFGIEGEHWVDENNDGAVEFIGLNDNEDGSFYWRYWYGNGYSYSLLTGKVDASIAGGADVFHNALIDINTNGIVSPHIGFVFDQANVVEEVTACSAVVAEYYAGQLAYPASVADVDKTIEDFRAKLTANGIDKIIAEVQAQLDAFHGK